MKSFFIRSPAVPNQLYSAAMGISHQSTHLEHRYGFLGHCNFPLWRNPPSPEDMYLSKVRDTCTELAPSLCPICLLLWSLNRGHLFDGQFLQLFFEEYAYLLERKHHCLPVLYLFMCKMCRNYSQKGGSSSTYYFLGVLAPQRDRMRQVSFSVWKNLPNMIPWSILYKYVHCNSQNWAFLWIFMAKYGGCPKGRAFVPHPFFDAL